MPDSKLLLERARDRAPETPFGLEEVRDRRTSRERRRRVGATIVGLGLTVAILAGAASAMVSSPSDEGTRGPMSGVGLPPAHMATLGPGEYSYQRIRYGLSCEGCEGSGLLVASWWASDDSGRIDVLERRNYGIDAGSFGPGEFPDEGDLSAFPTDPAALEAFLLDRSGSSGASPRPEVTPAPGVPLDEGQLWLAIRDYLGSTQYLNATPELRAAMLRVLAEVPMVSVDPGAADPSGRAATVLRFHAYDADVEVFVAPDTGDFLAMTERFDDGGVGSIVVEAAGIAASDHALPHGDERTVSPAS